MAVVKINAIQVPPQAGEPSWSADSPPAPAPWTRLPGSWFQLLRPVAGDDRYFVVTHWEDEASFEKWRDGDAGAATPATTASRWPAEPICWSSRSSST